MPFKNPYTKVVRAGQIKYDLENTGPVLLSELPETSVKTPGNLNKTWGPWSFEIVDYEGEVYYCLYHEAMDYEIDLETVNSTADAYRVVAHMAAKSTRMYGEGFVAFLCDALEDVCEQSNIDLRGCNEEFNGAKVAAKYYSRIRQKRAVSARTRHLILERDGFKCLDCGATPASGALLEIDHTIPISKGGSNDPSNLRTLCSDCNRGKSARIVQYD